MAKRWVAALAAAGCIGGAQAAIVTGVYDLTGSFGNGGPFASNRLVMNTTYDTDTNALSIDVTRFDLDDVSYLSQGEYIVENLGGNGRFRATFRQIPVPSIPSASETFEVFYRFVYDFNNDAPVTSGRIVSILSFGSDNFSRTATATFTPTVPPPNPNGISEPGAAWLALLALVAAAAARRGI